MIRASSPIAFAAALALGGAAFAQVPGAGIAGGSAVQAAQPQARQQPHIVDGPAPAWVKPFDVDLKAPAKGGPATLLHVERQTRLDGMNTAIELKLAFRIDSPQGLPLATVAMPDLAPFHVVTLSEASLIRGGVKIASLKASDFELSPTNRTPGLEAPDFLWNATARFDGVQVGDIVVLSYTVAGSSPDQTKRAARLYLKSPTSGGISPARLIQRVIWPAAHSVVLQRSYDAAALTPSDIGDYREILIDQSPPEVAETEEGAPAEDQRAPFVDVTEFSGWAEVANDLAALHEPLIARSSAAKTIAAEIRAQSSDPAVQVVLALRKVQDEVAYYEMGLSSGGYTPRPPDEVWRRRAGDCKDKATLFVAILRALGIDAEPAAVQAPASSALSSDNVSPREGAASPIAFNHEIARVVVGGKVYWLDATRELQRGPLDSIDQFQDGWALPLKAGVTDLERIEPPAPAPPLVREDLVYDFRTVPGKLTVKIKRTDRGAAADVARQLIAASQPSLFSAYYDERLGARTDGWTVAPMAASDDVSGEVVTSAEQEIDSPFQTLQVDGKPMDVFLDRARLRLNLPVLSLSDKPRKLPVYIFRRYSYAEHIEIDLPDDPKYQIVFQAQHIETPAFVFDAVGRQLGPRSAVLDYTLRAKTGEVPASDGVSEFESLSRVGAVLPVIVAHRQ